MLGGTPAAAQQGAAIDWTELVIGLGATIRAGERYDARADRRERRRETSRHGRLDRLDVAARRADRGRRRPAGLRRRARAAASFVDHAQQRLPRRADDRAVGELRPRAPRRRARSRSPASTAPATRGTCASTTAARCSARRPRTGADATRSRLDLAESINGRRLPRDRRGRDRHDRQPRRRHVQPSRCRSTWPARRPSRTPPRGDRHPDRREHRHVAPDGRRDELRDARRPGTGSTPTTSRSTSRPRSTATRPPLRSPPDGTGELTIFALSATSFTAHARQAERARRRDRSRGRRATRSAGTPAAAQTGRLDGRQRGRDDQRPHDDRRRSASGLADGAQRRQRPRRLPRARRTAPRSTSRG